MCAQPTYTSRGQKAPASETHNGVNIIRCWSTTFSKDRLLLRLINVFTIVVSFFFKMLFRFRRGDRVLVVTNPPPLPFVASMAAKLRGAKTCLLIHDVYPDVLVPTGFTKPNSFAYRLINFATRWLYRSVDQIVTIGRDMRERVIAKSSDLEQKTVVIANWADENICPGLPSKNQLRQEMQLQDKFVIQYAGNMGRTHGLTLIAEAAAIVAEKGYSQIHWMLCGWGGGKPQLEERCESLNLTNVSIMDPVPRERLSELIGAADVSIISFIPGMSGISVPSRMYNILAVGCPLIGITEDDSELALTITDDNLGWVSPPEDAIRLADLVVNIYQHQDEISEYRQRCSESVKTRFAKPLALQRYFDAVTHVV